LIKEVQGDILVVINTQGVYKKRRGNMQCQWCEREVGQRVCFEVGSLRFDFPNQTNRCSRCIEKTFIHMIRMRDTQGCYFVRSRKGKIEVGWSLYLEWYKRNCDFEGGFIARYTFEEMTQILEHLGIISFESTRNGNYAHVHYNSLMKIGTRPIYLTRPRDAVELGRLRRQEHEHCPECQNQRNYLQFHLVPESDAVV